MAQGLLRGDTGDENAPFKATMLARDFIQIALYDEYAPGAGIWVSDPQVSRLRRWEQPIRIQVLFGPSVTEEQASKDRASVEAFAARLAL